LSLDLSFIEWTNFLKCIFCLFKVGGKKKYDSKHFYLPSKTKSDGKVIPINFLLSSLLVPGPDHPQSLRLLSWPPVQALPRAVT